MFKGVSGTGKTTTAEAVIRALRRRGFTVGSVKDIHYEGFTMETPGTNTDRHHRAGADPVTARGLRETDILFAGCAGIERILEAYTQDWVVLEGDSGANCPNLVTGGTAAEIDAQINDLTIGIAGTAAPELAGRAAAAANTEVRLDGSLCYRGLPLFDARTEADALVEYLLGKTPRRMPNYDTDCCEKCGPGGCRALLAGMLRGTRSREECSVREGTLQLFFDGQEVQIVDFVKDVLRGAAGGIVEQLDGYRPGMEVTIRFR
jgi:molybdopterin-guanine dinucleotide biosynthesis protein B